MGIHLIYLINKGLGIVPREFSDHLGLINVGENCSNQGDLFVYSKSLGDQPLPGRRVSEKFSSGVEQYATLRVNEELTG
jgi:hypothetical protein